LGAEILLNPSVVNSINSQHVTFKKGNNLYKVKVTREGPTDPQQSNGSDLIFNSCNFISNISINSQSVENTHDCKFSSELIKSIKTESKDNYLYSSQTFDSPIENETLPASSELFQDDLKLNFKILDNKFTIDDGDFSCCLPQYLSEIKSLLNDFNDRFSKSKLDIETTDIYTAELPTLPDRKVNQLVRRLPHHKALFALKAINQLKQAGVIRDSDSPW
jgi:hypothetical protein